MRQSNHWGCALKATVLNLKVLYVTLALSLPKPQSGLFPLFCFECQEGEPSPDQLSHHHGSVPCETNPWGLQNATSLSFSYQRETNTWVLLLFSCWLHLVHWHNQVPSGGEVQVCHFLPICFPWRPWSVLTVSSYCSVLLVCLPCVICPVTFRNHDIDDTGTFPDPRALKIYLVTSSTWKMPTRNTSSQA